MSATALERMIELLRQLAQQQTNPLLQLLPADEAVIEQRKYPAGPLAFKQQPIRAYYHCHPADMRPDNEHGHFHIFVSDADDNWSHLVALAMDPYGQPLNWFTVNRWVTDGEWTSPQNLIQRLGLVQTDSDMSLVEQWLLALLQLYQTELETLLQARDAYLEGLQMPVPFSERLEDRSIYQLSSCNIDLLKKLESLLQSPESFPAYG